MIDRQNWLVFRSSRSYQVPFLHTSHWHRLFTISMYLVAKQLIKTASCVCLTWIQLILFYHRMVSTLIHMISLATWPLFLYPDDRKQGELPVSSNNTSWCQRCAIDHRRSTRKGSTLGMTSDYSQAKSTILTHQWWFLNWSVSWLRVVSSRLANPQSYEAWLPGHQPHNPCWSPWKWWPLEFLEEVGSHLVPIIEELTVVKAEYKDPAVQIIDESDVFTWPHMDIHYG